MTLIKVVIPSFCESIPNTVIQEEVDRANKGDEAVFMGRRWGSPGYLIILEKDKYKKN
jgi:hypothetical protein